MSFVWGIVTGITLGIGIHLALRRRHQQTVKRLLERLVNNVGVETLASVDPASTISVLTKAFRQKQTDLYTLSSLVTDWETLAQRLPLGFLQVDENNVVTHCNLKARQLLQIKQWRPHIKVLLEWVRSYDLDQLIEQTRQQRQQLTKTEGQDVELDPEEHLSCSQMREWLFYPPGGEAKPIPIRGWGIGLADGKVGIFLEDRIEANVLTQQRDRWASDVAHELKTPLTSIRLVAETLQSRVDPGIRKWVDRLLNETIRLSSLVQDLLELSSLNLGAAAALQMKPVDLVPLTQEAWQSLDHQAKSREQTLDYQGPSEAFIWGDEKRLYRLFLNLFDNSIKYGKPGTHVHLVIQPDDGFVSVEVYDHGAGLTPDAFKAVFEPFYRTDTARARTEGGTGLGLAIVKQIVEAHGGTVQAANHPEAGGLWIRLTLRVQVLGGS